MDSNSSYHGPLNSDIVYIILDCLRQDLSKKDSESDGKTSILSHLSLVCREWANRFRPILFRRLVLCSRDDLNSFINFTSSPHSRLEDDIGHLDFMPAAGLAVVPWMHLIPTRFRKKIRKLYLDNPLGGSASPSLSSIFPALPRSLPSAFSPFTHVDVCNHSFRSFAEVSRLVNSLPDLCELGLYDVSWTSNPRRCLVLRHPRKLKIVHTSNLQQAWELLGLFPAAPIPESQSLNPREHSGVITQTDFEQLQTLTEDIVQHVFASGGSIKGSVTLSTETFAHQSQGSRSENVCSYSIVIRSASSHFVQYTLTRPKAALYVQITEIHLSLRLPTYPTKRQDAAIRQTFRILVRQTSPIVASAFWRTGTRVRISFVGHLPFGTNVTQIEEEFRRALGLYGDSSADSLVLDFSGLILLHPVPWTFEDFDAVLNVDPREPRDEKSVFKQRVMRFEQDNHLAIYLHDALRSAKVENDDIVSRDPPSLICVQWPGHEDYMVDKLPSAYYRKSAWAAIIAKIVMSFHEQAIENPPEELAAEHEKWDIRRIAFEQILLLEVRGDSKMWKPVLLVAMPALRA